MLHLTSLGVEIPIDNILLVNDEPCGRLHLSVKMILFSTKSRCGRTLCLPELCIALVSEVSV